MLSNTQLWVGGFVLVALTTIITLGINQHSQDLSKSKDIQAAVEKGVNPIAIRCAYAPEHDRICLVYAATRPNERGIDVQKYTK